MDTTPVVKDLVLVGGGHSHVEVIRRFAMRPIPGVRLSVVSREIHTPYSGMLPGLIAGHYAFDDAHIDLGPLVRHAGGRLYHAEVTGIDCKSRWIFCASRPPLAYDILSIDIGSAPDTKTPGAADFTIPVKPVSNFTNRWNDARQRILDSTTLQRIGIVGSGAGGVELLLAIRHHLRAAFVNAGREPDKLSFHLISASNAILPTHNSRVRKKFSDRFVRDNIKVHLDAKVIQVKAGVAETANGSSIELDEIFWVTTASAPNWPKECGLDVDDNGFIEVHATFESTSHSGIFATGDIAAVQRHPRPKSGVFAVRQGPRLAENLRRAVSGKLLRSFTPQNASLSLISTGDRYAIGARAWWAIEGAWVWRWKDWIDRRFMEKYRELPKMETRSAPAAQGHSFDRELHDLQSDPMRCGGCGSKVGADILRDALSALKLQSHGDVIVGLDSPDDAAVVKPHAGTVLVQTVDSFRSFIDDPFIFGKVAANHCLSDIFAMGATPQSALAVVTLPLAAAQKMRNDLVQLMSGALEVFAAEQTAVVGGHTNEGAELSLGFAINGYIDPARLSRKSGAKPADQLIVSKPLGTGVLFAAEMRGKAKSRWVESAILSMLQSNGPAATCLREFNASAITDITGFGLVGHLLEMLRASGVNATIELGRLPLFEGAATLAADGIVSSLHNNNRRVESKMRMTALHAQSPQYPLCFDPQTSGGLVASVPAEFAEACVAKLHQLGFDATVIVGSIDEPDDQNRSGQLSLR